MPPADIPRYPVIVVPGITATSLFDEYPIGGDEVWSAVLNKEYQRLTLHPDDLSVEAIEPARVQTGRLFDITYKDIILALRHELTPRADQPTPVFGFAYDWRRDVRESARQLDRMIEEVIARTKVLRHYAPWFNAAPKVHLVGHSMGGLVISEYLAQCAEKQRVAKVATLCTPFQGSIEAVCKLLTGIGYLSGEQPKERERESARTFQSVYQLLPSFAGAATRTGGAGDVDLFALSSWQTSLIESMAEFVRLHSVDGEATNDSGANHQAATSILERLLEGARAVSADVRGLGPRLAAAGLTPNDWLAVVGVGAKTRLGVKVDEKNGAPWFCIDEAAFQDAWSKNPASDKTGDGTVPLRGAVAPFLPLASHVAVKPGDFGMFELADRALLGVAGFHAQVPNLNLAQRLVVKHLVPSFGGSVWGRRVPGAGEWTPPIDGLEEKR